jgi:LacI family transcriptional regulator
VRKPIGVAQDTVRHLLSVHPRPTAALAESDLPAIVIMKAALMCGVRVPTDFSVVGFDDIAFAELCTPGLTTIRQPLDAMGRYAATALLDRIGGQEVAPPPVDLAEQAGPNSVFRPALIRRESTGSPVQ